MKTKAATLLMTLSVSCIAAQQIHASDRALLVSIGRYGPASPLPDLPGAAIDLAKMNQATRVMGFATGQIRNLTDEAATAAGIRSAIEDWLIAGTSPGDRALLYFSGHGSQVIDRGVRDETDGWDEVLAAHDVRLATRGGQPYATGVVTDDELFELLGRLDGREVTVIVDACSSATATRGQLAASDVTHLDQPIRVAKSGILERTDVGSAQAPSGTGGTLVDRSQDWITLSAAPDGGIAIATEYGSLFTQALHARLLEARHSQSPFPMVALQAAAAEFLVGRDLLPVQPPMPVLTGPRELMSKGIRLVPASPRGPIRQHIEQLATETSGSLLTTARTNYRFGEIVDLSVAVPQAGYLNVVVVDSDDQAQVLFPNKLHPNNLVSAQTRLRFIESELGFNLQADNPLGESYVLAIFTDTSRPLNFYYEALAEYGPKEALSRQEATIGVRMALAKLSEKAIQQAKGIKVTAPRTQYVAQGLIVNVSAKP